MLSDRHNPQSFSPTTASKIVASRRYPMGDQARALPHNRRPQGVAFPFTLYLQCNSAGVRIRLRISAMREEISAGAAAIAPDIPRMTEHAFIGA
jgi:hypothetical protein